MQMKYTKIDSAPALIILSVLCVSLLNLEQENHTSCHADYLFNGTLAAELTKIPKTH